jgi:iron(III) transport system ATP-binding protein
MSIGIEFQSVSKQYDAKSKAKAAVDSISFQVEKGSLTTLLGPSGCGKTTTLRMIAGLETPSAGRVFIDGQDVTGLGPAERNVSLVFQSYALFPHMSVLENVAYGPSVSGLSKGAAQDKAKIALATVGLTGYELRMPSELSGGQQQRVAVARALVLEPSVLLFDEPLSNLDARLRRQMREEIRSLQQRLKLTVAYVTHDQSEALAVSDKIIVMNQGKIAQQGSPRELYELPNSEFVAGFMGEAALMRARRRSGRLYLGQYLLPETIGGAGGTSAEAGNGSEASPEGDEVVLAIRPESWHLKLAGELAPESYSRSAVSSNGPSRANELARSDTGLHGQVKQATYLGGSYEYTVSTDLGDIFLISPLRAAVAKTGDQVVLSLFSQGVAVLA